MATRVAAIAAWSSPPDFVSVNLWEEGWCEIAVACLAARIDVEAGELVRALVEGDGGAEDARAVSALIPAGVDQLWHGSGALTWEVIAAAAALSHDVRVGFEDVVLLPDGAPAASNADLVTAAIELVQPLTPFPR